MEGFLYIDVPGIVRVISLLISLFLIFLITVVNKRAGSIGKPTTVAAVQPENPGDVLAVAAPDSITARWEEIKRHVSSANPAEWKFAVLEADKLVDFVLDRAGFPGETMGEKLMAIDQSQIATIQGLWQAHKLRNQIAHDMNYFIRDVDARKAVEQFEATLMELQAL
jgi:hypothetical protein